MAVGNYMTFEGINQACEYNPNITYRFKENFKNTAPADLANAVSEMNEMYKELDGDLRSAAQSFQNSLASMNKVAKKKDPLENDEGLASQYLEEQWIVPADGGLITTTMLKNWKYSTSDVKFINAYNRSLACGKALTKNKLYAGTYPTRPLSLGRTEPACLKRGNCCTQLNVSLQPAYASVADDALKESAVALYWIDRAVAIKNAIQALLSFKSTAETNSDDLSKLKVACRETIDMYMCQRELERQRSLANSSNAYRQIKNANAQYYERSHQDHPMSYLDMAALVKTGGAVVSSCREHFAPGFSVYKTGVLGAKIFKYGTKTVGYTAKAMNATDPDEEWVAALTATYGFSNLATAGASTAYHAHHILHDGKTAYKAVKAAIALKNVNQLREIVSAGKMLAGKTLVTSAAAWVIEEAVTRGVGSWAQGKLDLANAYTSIIAEFNEQRGILNINERIDAECIYQVTGCSQYYCEVMPSPEPSPSPSPSPTPEASPDPQGPPVYYCSYPSDPNFNQPKACECSGENTRHQWLTDNVGKPYMDPTTGKAAVDLFMCEKFCATSMLPGACMCSTLVFDTSVSTTGEIEGTGFFHTYDKDAASKLPLNYLTQTWMRRYKPVYFTVTGFSEPILDMYSCEVAETCAHTSTDPLIDGSKTDYPNEVCKCRGGGYQYFDESEHLFKCSCSYPDPLHSRSTNVVDPDPKPYWIPPVPSGLKQFPTYPGSMTVWDQGDIYKGSCEKASTECANENALNYGRYEPCDLGPNATVSPTPSPAPSPSPALSIYCSEGEVPGRVNGYDTCVSACQAGMKQVLDPQIDSSICIWICPDGLVNDPSQSYACDIECDPGCSKGISYQFPWTASKVVSANDQFYYCQCQ